jgi:hypothetical protein
MSARHRQPKPRWPLTLMLLRSQLDDLSSCEYRDWLDRVINYIRNNDLDCARRATGHLDEIWLLAGDPS